MIIRKVVLLSFLVFFTVGVFGQESEKTVKEKSVKNKKTKNVRSSQKVKKSKTQSEVNELSEEEVKKIISNRIIHYNEEISMILKTNEEINTQNDLLQLLRNEINGYPYNFIFLVEGSDEFNSLLENNQDILRAYSVLLPVLVNRAKLITNNK